jgi:hypothetical protein
MAVIADSENTALAVSKHVANGNGNITSAGGLGVSLEAPSNLDLGMECGVCCAPVPRLDAGSATVVARSVTHVDM